MAHNGGSQAQYQYCPGGGTSSSSSKLLRKFQGSLVNPAGHFLIAVRWGGEAEERRQEERKRGEEEGRHECVNALAVYVS